MKKLLLVAALLSVAACAHKPASESNMQEAAALEEGSPWRIPAQEGVESYTMSENGRRTVDFARCKGRAELMRLGDKLTLRITGSNCANLVTDFGEWKLNGTGSEGRYIDVTIRDDVARMAKITVGSNKYVDTNGREGNADVFWIRVVPRYTSPVLRLKWTSDTQEYRLERCGGTVEGKIKNGQLNVIFRDMRFCNLFDILSDSEGSLNYDAKVVQQQGDGYGGSYTIPKRFIDVGSNAIVVQVYSLSGAREKIRLEFYGR